MSNLTIAPHKNYNDLYVILGHCWYWGVNTIVDKYDLEYTTVRNLLKQYDHIVLDIDVILFKNREDVKAALEWINTLELAKKLS